ncbi:protocadherin-10-like [Scyliorhinus torazame]|uniref:protocadherin-10-like n=1 Tax=Scyliorhinus torazame TaxID=75743 RepID=UPI003B5C49A3
MNTGLCVLWLYTVKIIILIGVPRIRSCAALRKTSVMQGADSLCRCGPMRISNTSRDLLLLLRHRTRTGTERQSVPAFILWKGLCEFARYSDIKVFCGLCDRAALALNKLPVYFCASPNITAMAEPRITNALKFRPLGVIFLLFVSDLVFGKIHYSIREEMESGAFIGDVAEDLGLNIRRLSARKFRLVPAGQRQCLEVNLETGILFASERIDREQLCGQMPACVLSFQIVVEEPLEMYRGEVEIVDINDNSPSFPESFILLQMAETMAPVSRFPLESALDPDMGTNAVSVYNISPNEHFGLKVETAEDGTKIVELLLEKPLDRERQSSFQLMLTATDGGSPPRSGTARILITVLDSNDNVPAFDSKIYKVSLTENSPRGSLVVSVHATDPDEGSNGEVTYFFSNRVSQKMQELFSLDARTGEIRVQGIIDYEEDDNFSLDIHAVDNGSPAIAGRSKVLVKVIDVNDNAPGILLTSVAGIVREDAVPGTVTALIDVIDRDSGINGQVHCEIPKNVPFKLQSSSSGHYKLITNDMLDRETTPLYNIDIVARDSGSPPRSTNKTIQITVSDINDNAPRFARPMDTVYVTENNAPGASIFAVTAFDPDQGQNSYITYSFTENLIQELPLSNYLNLNSMNGTIYALRSFDYERVKNFQIQVRARDAGVPPLSSSATLNVIILDQNDNAPVIVSPSAQSGSAGVEVVPQSAGQGYLVTKIIATDADSGQNARLLYQVLKATEPSLLIVGHHSGEIRTARGILEQDSTTQSLVILVKDNGQPSLSSTATIHFSILGNVTEIFSESSNLVTNPEYVSDINLYLIVILGSTSFIFLIIIILLIGIKCKQDRNTPEVYNSPSCCHGLDDSNNAFNLTPTLKESLNYTGAGEIIHIPETHHYSVCLSPESAKSDFLFLKPYTPPMTQDQC